MIKPSELRKAVQQLLKDNGFDPGPIDGDFGDLTYKAIERLDLAVDGGEIHRVKASSFADPADIRAFKRCIEAGGTEMQCYRVGDNGIGKWGDDTTANVPMCALPYEDWMERWGEENARGKLVRVTSGGLTVDCELRDTMKHRANIPPGGARIDLNPAACAKLALLPPVLTNATWQWVDDIS